MERIWCIISVVGKKPEVCEQWLFVKTTELATPERLQPNNCNGAHRLRLVLDSVRPMYKCLLCKWCKCMLVSLGRVQWLSLCGARMVFDCHGLLVCAEVGNSKLWAGVWSSWLEADRETRLRQFSIKWLREGPRLARGLMHPQCFI